MTNKIFSALKVVTLAIALSFGLSYVYAWTAPSTTPPTGNVSAPINTGADLQSKGGGLTVKNFIADTVTVGATPNTGAISSPKFCIGASCIDAWAQANDSETGLSAVLAPLKNKTISCVSGIYTYSASVSSAGALSVRMTYYDGDNGVTVDSGWVAGKITGSFVTRAQADATGLFGFDRRRLAIGTGWYYTDLPVCSAVWPAN